MEAPTYDLLSPTLDLASPKNSYAEELYVGLIFLIFSPFRTYTPR